LAWRSRKQSEPILDLLAPSILQTLVEEEPPKNRSNSAGDFRAFDPLSQPEAGFRENVWHSGARNRVPKYG
jgi:hypothetical protein